MSVNIEQTRLSGGKEIHKLIFNTPEGQNITLPIKLVIKDGQAAFWTEISSPYTGDLHWSNMDLNALCTQVTEDVESAVKAYFGQSWKAAMAVTAKNELDERRTNFPEISPSGSGGPGAHSFGLNVTVTSVKINPDVSRNDGTREIVDEHDRRRMVRQTTAGEYVEPMKTGDAAHDMRSKAYARQDGFLSRSFVFKDDTSEAKIEEVMSFLNRFGGAVSRRFGASEMDLKGVPTPAEIVEIARRAAETNDE